MRDQEIIGLWEAYQQVHAQPQEEVEQLDEISRSMGRRAKEYRRKQEQDAHMERVRQHQHNMENDPEYRAKHEASRTVHSRRNNGGEDQKESVDLFDYLLEYLVAEGYADTNKAALVIMANMSEEWKQSIIEDVDAQGNRSHDLFTDKPNPKYKPTQPKKPAPTNGFSTRPGDGKPYADGPLF